MNFMNDTFCICLKGENFNVSRNLSLSQHQVLEYLLLGSSQQLAPYNPEYFKSARVIASWLMATDPI